MKLQPVVKNERGIALVVVLLVVLAVAAIVAGAALLGSNTSLINKNQARLTTLESVADAGIEETRSAINGNSAIYPDSNYSTLESGATVYAADGSAVPNVKRWIYEGPTGVTTGEYGVFGSVVVKAQDPQGNTVVRRGEIYQESFAKYAYFTNVEGSIVFANGDQIYGPVHSNDVINIASSGATFFGPVTTAKTISGVSYGTFKQGYRQNAPVIPLPQTAALGKLQAQAAIGGTSITGNTSGASSGQATTRIEFVALDLDADGDSSDDDEGFMKVYQVTNAANAWWVVADTNAYAGSSNTSGVRNSPNCGHVYTGTGTNHAAGGFVTFANHLTTWTTGNDSKNNAPQYGTTRCYLGGSDSLNSPKVFTPTDARGHWLPWTGAVDPRVTAVKGAEAAYLWPISRNLNPNFKGVIYVSGRVAVSGKLRGRVTLAASDNIVLADDITYISNPGTGNCKDILGMFSGNDIVVADNLINDPIPYISSSSTPIHWDETNDMWINGFVLALDIFTVESYSTGSSNATPCGASNSGRGCLYLTGGIIQKQRGAVGLTSGQGYIKRYSYDQCGASAPPPYFPTTGHFVSGHYYEVEPTGFNIATYWPLLVPSH